ncbi:gamma-glutamyltransferase [Thiohalocapsa halophila]|uniref:Gamma-glutamyltransferase n=1 Tax=Thiohalocapsa halophila TaxID=69359 RepID=A0ABS1CG51_9GAMM|nr:gamma-glutamyltransferase [Thiohalocapsa halophila]MBK1630869.1 gamma-glutamyltransferase [Thiohalocapsa halophila]
MSRAIVAAGHPDTAAAAAAVLAAGGNAFDGAVAALVAACVAEPVLASLGGGGFLHARPAGEAPQLFDFFTQTPGCRATAAGLDFYPVHADFGDATQEFHIGRGAMATPGAVAGLFAIQRHLCRLPLADLLAPARALAERGVAVNPVQHGIARIVEPILRADPATFALHASPSEPTRLATVGERIPWPDFAAALDALAAAGPGLLHGGPWSERLAADCATGGGHLTVADLADYRVAQREPLVLDYRDARLYLNPPPSVGGALLALTLELLGETSLGGMDFGNPDHRLALAAAMAATAEARAVLAPGRLPDATARAAQRTGFPARLAALGLPRHVFRRGTTQISIADGDGNLASLTLSNGEGAAYVLPGTGIVMNNMLGEADLAGGGGFHQWPENTRVGSMMCPTLVAHGDGGWTVTGSSGSNRIRSAILQVLVNRIDLHLPLAEAVAAPRLHLEGEALSLEPPVAETTRAALAAHWPRLQVWRGRSVFFGGAHSVGIDAGGGLHGAGDARRGGVVQMVD